MSRVTRDELIKLVTNVNNVEIEGMVFGIRPITWQEEVDIEESVSAQKTEEMKVRERIVLTAWTGLVEPKLSLEEVKNLPVGLVTKLAMKVSEISSGVEKN